jgi:histone deacetylase 11
VDCLADDPLANLALTPDGIVQRDALVFAEAARCHVPIVMVLGGGYSKSAWEVQYRSIHGLIERYGQADRRADSAPATAPAPP